MHKWIKHSEQLPEDGIYRVRLLNLFEGKEINAAFSKNLGWCEYPGFDDIVDYEVTHWAKHDDINI